MDGTIGMYGKFDVNSPLGLIHPLTVYITQRICRITHKYWWRNIYQKLPTARLLYAEINCIEKPSQLCFVLELCAEKNPP